MAHSSATRYPDAQGSSACYPFSPSAEICLLRLWVEKAGCVDSGTALSPLSSRSISLSKLLKVTLPQSPRTVGPVLARTFSISGAPERRLKPSFSAGGCCEPAAGADFAAPAWPWDTCGSRGPGFSWGCVGVQQTPAKRLSLHLLITALDSSLFLRAGAACVYGSETVPKVTEVIPKYGSINGATRLTIKGEGFSQANQFNYGADSTELGNHVQLVSSFQSITCDVEKDSSHSTQITCYTRAMPEDTYTVRVSVDGVPIAENNTCRGLASSRACSFSKYVRMRFSSAWTNGSPNCCQEFCGRYGLKLDHPSGDTGSVICKTTGTYIASLLDRKGQSLNSLPGNPPCVLSSSLVLGMVTKICGNLGKRKQIGFVCDIYDILHNVPSFLRGHNNLPFKRRHSRRRRSDDPRAVL
ncbi:hypothetical protein ACRRTK_023338 [Alexandromys fortis]